MSSSPLIVARGGPARVLSLSNGTASPFADIPCLELADLRQLVIGAGARGRRVSALFAHRRGARVGLVVVLAVDGDAVVEIARTELDGTAFPSMTPECPEVHLFEREIFEQWGVTPIGHPWLKPVRSLSPYEYYAIEGGEVHEVAVGPVHAGVIEPGHFRFQCYGESVLHLEISLGYQHRGVERALIGGPAARSVHYAETLAGDTTIGHATAYCQAVEALGGATVPPRALALRAIALELERLANHVGDLGALAGDVGFLPTAAFCGRLRGDFLNLTAELCGSRFGRSLVRPGGTLADVTPELAQTLAGRVEQALRQTEEAASLLWEVASVQARFEDVGRVPTAIAEQLGAVGLVARAAGLHRDIRATHPTGYYRFAQLPISMVASGDVFARAFVRFQEIKRSAELVGVELRRLPRGAVKTAVAAPKPDHICISLVEGWRGEVCHVAITDAAGRFAAYKIVDPSFHNWMVLALALRGQQISDFPLCNKSFNLSYCGHDL